MYVSEQVRLSVIPPQSPDCYVWAVMCGSSVFQRHGPVLSAPCHFWQPEGCWHCFDPVVLSLYACLPLSGSRGARLAASFSEHYSQKLTGGKVLPSPMSPWGFLCSCFQDNSIPKSCMFVYLFVLNGLFLSP